MQNLNNALCAMLLCVLSGCIHMPPLPDMSRAVSSSALEGKAPVSATVPVLIDDRMYVDIIFTRPDGTPRKATAYVNMGSVPLVLSNELFRELQPVPGNILHMQFGTMDIGINGVGVQPETMANNASVSINPFARSKTAQELAQESNGQMASMNAPLKVEAILPAGVLQHFEVAFDYGAKTMTLATPGTLKAEGVGVPMRIDQKSGLVTMEANIDGKSYPFVLDNGGGFSAAHDIAPWLDAHPEWLRSIGGIGPANLLMGPFDAAAPVLKIPNVSLGNLALDELGLVQPGPQGWIGRHAADWLFWDRIYSDKAGEPVRGWIGGNVLKSFRLTIDYSHHMTYWQQEMPIDTRDLDQVGLVLGRNDGITTIVGIAKKNGVPTVAGVVPGDRLLKIDGVETATLLRGKLLNALHGKPGEHKLLVLERNGTQFEIDAVVTAF